MLDEHGEYQYNDRELEDQVHFENLCKILDHFRAQHAAYVAWYNELEDPEGEHQFECRYYWYMAEQSWQVCSALKEAARLLRSHCVC